MTFYLLTASLTQAMSSTGYVTPFAMVACDWRVSIETHQSPPTIAIQIVPPGSSRNVATYRSRRRIIEEEEEEEEAAAAAATSTTSLL